VYVHTTDCRETQGNVFPLACVRGVRGWVYFKVFEEKYCAGIYVLQVISAH
jgi:hypothetical protein